MIMISVMHHYWSLHSVINLQKHSIQVQTLSNKSLALNINKALAVGVAEGRSAVSGERRSFQCVLHPAYKQTLFT